MWDPQHRRQAEKAALVRRRRQLTVVPAEPSDSQELDQAPLPLEGDYRVDAPDLGRYRIDDTGQGGEG